MALECYAGNAKRRTVIKPVPEAIEAILYKVLCCSKVEPWIDCTLELVNCTIMSLWWY